ncbi:hypothetical protein [Zavarzinella formosa]|nr:hypothetical protein [Zavarzinella formosa]
MEWRVWRQVLATCTEDAPMMGMRLLAGHHLSVEAKPGGAVEITPLP